MIGPAAAGAGACLAVAALAALPLVQEVPAKPVAAAKVRIAHRVHSGLVYSVEELRRKHLRYVLGNVAGKDGKAQEVPAEVEQISRESWTDTIRETAGGLPTRLERHYHARTSYERHHTTTQDVQVRRPLHGRTLELRTTEAGVRVKAMTGGDLKAADTADIRLLPAVLAFLPEKPVGVGERWRLNARSVGRLLGAPGTGSKVSGAFASLESIEMVELRPGMRHRIAVLKAEFTLATPLRPDLVLESKLRGTVRVDLTAEQLLRADLTGTLSAKSDPRSIPKGAVSVEVKGEVAFRVIVKPGRVDPGGAAASGGRR